MIILVLFLTQLFCSFYTFEAGYEKHIIPVYGNFSLRYYYANIFVGNPPQKQAVILDTGSGQLAIPCKTCTSCNKAMYEAFDMAKSSTCKEVLCIDIAHYFMKNHICTEYCSKDYSSPLPCQFDYLYLDKTQLSGNIISDKISFESDSSSNASARADFGCITKESSNSRKLLSNGILGLTPIRTDLFLENYALKNVMGILPIQITYLVFSLCLARNGGIMILGLQRNEKSNYSKDKPIRINFNALRNKYDLQNVQELRLNDTILFQKNDSSFQRIVILIDSGSTLTLFPQKYFNQFVQTIDKSCTFYRKHCKIALGSLDRCYRVDYEGLTANISRAVSIIFPIFTIKIKGSDVLWHPQSYFLLRDIKNKEICLGLYSRESKNLAKTQSQKYQFILGANWMINRDIIFDTLLQTIDVYSNSTCSKEQEIEMSAFSQNIHFNAELEYIEMDGTFADTLLKILKSFAIFGFIGGILFLVNYCIKLRKGKRDEAFVEFHEDHVQGSDMNHVQGSDINEIRRKAWLGKFQSQGIAKSSEEHRTQDCMEQSKKPEEMNL